MLPEFLPVLHTARDTLSTRFYQPCLEWATHYDRGVGFFTSAWIRENAVGMAHFASKGGHARWLISPMITAEDFEAIQRGQEGPDNIALLRALTNNLDEVVAFLEEDTRDAIAWMIYDAIIEIRFAVPAEHLEGGDFHPKFGIFSDEQGNSLAFVGSVNDSHKGTINFETITTFATWRGMGEYVSEHLRLFEDLWGNRLPSVKIYDLPEAIRAKILQLRSPERPYSRATKVVAASQLWPHQVSAAEAFLLSGSGVLEMATGTGKTRTALAIVRTLTSRGEVDRVIVSADGTDLLQQWYNTIQRETTLVPLRCFDRYNDVSEFRLHSRGACLVVSRDFLARYFNQIAHGHERTLAIFDEVHGLGSPNLVRHLSGRIRDFRFRLGLSATPEREYDQDGNEFIKAEVGSVLFQYGIEDAIKDGVLCEFDYVPLEFQFDDEDQQKRRPLVAALQALSTRQRKGENVADQIADVRRRIGLVRKLSKAKLPVFDNYLRTYSNVLHRAIIFVETVEYGQELEAIIMKYNFQYHTYFGDDARSRLLEFADGRLNCLLTCKRIAEGIDIRSTDNVILLTADAGKLQTIQRMGRCLRVDPANPKKRARVVDFVELSQEADQDRLAWLQGLALTRRRDR